MRPRLGLGEASYSRHCMRACIQGMASATRAAPLHRNARLWSAVGWMQNRAKDVLLHRWLADQPGIGAGGLLVTPVTLAKAALDLPVWMSTRPRKQKWI